jgi:hypothetical protein
MRVVVLFVGLGLQLSCSLSQELQLRLSREQRLELKQQLSQKLSQLVKELRADSPDSPEQLYQAVAKEVVRRIRNPELAAWVGPFLTDESTRRHVIKNQVPLSRPSRDSIRTSALEYMHEVNGGTFSFKTTGADSEAILCLQKQFVLHPRRDKHLLHPNHVYQLSRLPLLAS